MKATIIVLLFLTGCALPSQGMRTLGLSSVLHLITAHGPAKNDTPWFCHGIDCPQFVVLEHTNDYELRRYPAGKWVSTDVDDYDGKDAVYTGFMRLFNYIGGDNLDTIKIDMTAPVRTRVLPGQGPFCKSHFTVSFFVPFEYQAFATWLGIPTSKLKQTTYPNPSSATCKLRRLTDDPPEPLRPDLYIETDPEMEVYVNAFPGFARGDDTFLNHARQLAEVLESEGKSFNASMYYAAGYDPPFRLLNRHNEVWLVKTSG